MILIMQALIVASINAQQYEPVALEWRFIGPIVGNRGSVVLGHPTEPNVFLMVQVMVFGKLKMRGHTGSQLGIKILNTAVSVPWNFPNPIRILPM